MHSFRKSRVFLYFLKKTIEIENTLTYHKEKRTKKSSSSNSTINEDRWNKGRQGTSLMTSDPFSMIFFFSISIKCIHFEHQLISLRSQLLFDSSRENANVKMGTFMYVFHVFVHHYRPERIVYIQRIRGSNCNKENLIQKWNKQPPTTEKHAMQWMNSLGSFFLSLNNWYKATKHINKSFDTNLHTECYRRASVTTCNVCVCFKKSYSMPFRTVHTPLPPQHTLKCIALSFICLCFDYAIQRRCVQCVCWARWWKVQVARTAFGILRFIRAGCRCCSSRKSKLALLFLFIYTETHIL